MLHSVIVTTEKCNVLMTRYLIPLTTEKKQLFEQFLFKSVTSSGFSANPVDDGDVKLIGFENFYVVYQKIGELIWFLAGNGEYDELICHDILNTLISIANVHFEKKFTEIAFLANHSKILVSLDEMIFQGHIDNNDIHSILQMSKLKPFPTKA